MLADATADSSAYVFAQMLDDYTRLRHAGSLPLLHVAGPPGDRVAGGRGFRRDGRVLAQGRVTARRGPGLPEREAWPWWFVTDLRA